MNNFPNPGECGCIKCSLKWDEENLEPISACKNIMTRIKSSRLSRFIVCEICGNKRCPHATDHELSCTNSNESGQKGSVYE